MDYLIDTNILLRGMDRRSDLAQVIRSAMKGLRRAGRHLCVAPQNLIEFWCVATRPREANGLGLTTVQTVEQITQIKNLFPLLSERADVYSEWEHLVSKFHVVGKQAHDARLVALMTVCGIRNLLTFNVGDFSRYDHIHAVDPRTALSELEP